MGQIYQMTDKKDFKDLPCQHPTCENYVRVNKFYTPAKARCPDHGGKAMVREPIAAAPKGGATEKKTSTEFTFRELEAKVIGNTPDAPKIYNKKLGDLCCPVCTNPMKINAISDNYRFINFGCPDLECNTAVEIQFDWTHAVVRHIPEGLEDLVAEFNRRQTIFLMQG